MLLFIYFLLYPVLGPMIGYFGILFIILLSIFFGQGNIPDFSWGSLELGDAMSLLPAAYVFGIIQAVFVGRYATKFLSEHGKSFLLKNLGVSIGVNLVAFVLFVLAFMLGNDTSLADRLGVAMLLIGAGIFATVVLWGVEWVLRFLFIRNADSMGDVD